MLTKMDRLGMFQFDGVQFPNFDNAVREEGRNEIFEMVRMVMSGRLVKKREQEAACGGQQNTQQA